MSNPQQNTLIQSESARPHESEEEDSDENLNDHDHEEPVENENGYMSTTASHHRAALQGQGQEDQHPSQDDNNTMELDDDADRASDSSFSDSVSMSSSPSVPSSDDIDFTLVYALHTFLATVDGQASVVKGDQLTLLDDSNSYWWLIRVLKTQAVGYIPAENIETPYERLARLNKHRNVDLSSATPHDHISGPGSSLAQTRFSQRIPSAGDPVRSRSPQDRRKGPQPPPMPGPGTFSPPLIAPAPGTGKGKTVAFTAPTYFENSGNEWSEEEGSGEEGASEEEGDEEEWEEEAFGEEGEEGFEDEEEDTEEEEEEEDDLEGDKNSPESQRQLEDQLSREQLSLRGQSNQQPPAQQNPPEDLNKGTSGWARLRLAAKASADSLRGSKDDGRSQLGKGIAPSQRPQPEFSSGPRDLTPRSSQLAVATTSAAAPLAIETQNQAAKQGNLNGQQQKRPTRPFDEVLAEEEPRDSSGSFETKKLTLTPDIARDSQDTEFPPVSSSSSPQSFGRQRTPSGSSAEASTGLRKYAPTGTKIREEDEHTIGSNEGHSQSLVSLASIDSSGAGGSEESKNGFGKRGVLKKDKEDGEGKKKKGLLSGLFGRKKDKKAKTGPNDAGDDATVAMQALDVERISPSSSPSDQSSHSPTAGDITPTGTPGPRRSRSGSADLFLTDAALKKQQAEAEEVMCRHYGISRSPSDTANTTTFPITGKPILEITSNQPFALQSAPAKPAANGPLSPLSPIGSLNGIGSPSFPAGQRLRPGSLIGSPSVPGMEAPMLNVLRIFAGENVNVEATFKTVLLSTQTTTKELILQAMQRFHLPSEPEHQASYYLTIKDVASGEESMLAESQLPLKVFETMNEGQEGLMLPCVKRSSVGSMSSITSNLSLNPAISKLGMSDFSDDSAVKFYINCYASDYDRAFAKNKVPGARKNGLLEPIQEDHGLTEDNASDKGTIMAHIEPVGASFEPSSEARLSQASTASNSSSSGTAEQVTSPSITSPSLRFAMRIQIYPTDLPDGVVFDPHSTAIIPKHILNERGKRTSSTSSNSSTVSLTMREKVLLFPRNINVSEAIEHALEVFGISEGVVDGGDDVEEKISKRRSVSRVRYGLSVKLPNHSSDVPVQLTAKVLDAYPTQPTFRPPDRTSKEARRRSQEGSFVFGSVLDLQATDPVFILRRASPSYPLRRESLRSSTGLAGAAADELGLMASKKPSSGGVRSPLATTHPRSTLAQKTVLPVGKAAELTAAQRAAFLSATKNSEQGVDITLNDRTTLRSKRATNSESYRYSYIDPTGSEVDISELMETEWSPTFERKPGPPKLANASSQNSLSSVTEDGYASAPESPMVGPKRVESPMALEEEAAIEALRLAPLTIGRQASSNDASAVGHTQKKQKGKKRDLLMAALDKPRVALQSETYMSPPMSSEPVEKRIQRVLAKVKAGRAAQLASKTSGTPATAAPAKGVTRELGPAALDAGPHESKPELGLTRPPSIDQVIAPPGTGTGAGRTPSVASGSRSDSTTGTNSPETPVTATSPSTYTPVSSATRGVGIDSRQSNMRGSAPDVGIEVLLNLLRCSAGLATGTLGSVAMPRSGKELEGDVEEMLGFVHQSSDANHVKGGGGVGDISDVSKRAGVVDNRLDAIEDGLDRLLMEIM